ncbi:hypothetical protein DFH11DRAFT_1834041 [Phellopilus nigrolimitatus]|nr:hypothetical protein DFH11DRAFT_1834041 [Phellopilus nigrolimitatus]
METRKREPKVKAKGDIDMNMDEASLSASPAGNISPTTGAVSNLPEVPKSEGKAPKSKRSKSELSFEKLPNFTAQRLFPTCSPCLDLDAEDHEGEGIDSICSENTPSLVPLGLTFECYAGNGKILILTNQSLDEPAEYIEAELPVLVPAVEATASPALGAAVSAPTGPHIALDEDAPSS